jgi:hypothetical protein
MLRTAGAAMALIVAAAGFAAAQDAVAKPDILMIMADDIGCRTSAPTTFG